MSTSELHEHREASEPATEDSLEDSLPSTGLLSFYDRLRERVVESMGQRGGRGGNVAGEALMLVPDVFMLLARLSIDREVPKATRALFASTLAYFVLPFDLLPEAMVGVPGYVDDLILATGVVSRALGGDLESYSEKYWSGSQSLRRTLADVLATAQGLAGTNLYARLKTLLAKQGVDLDEAATASEDD